MADDLNLTNCYANQKLFHRGIKSYFIDSRSRHYVYINQKNDLCIGKVNKHLMPQSYFKQKQDSVSRIKAFDSREEFGSLYYYFCQNCVFFISRDLSTVSVWNYEDPG